MLALSIFTQNNGERTKVYYDAMKSKGPMESLPWLSSDARSGLWPRSRTGRGSSKATPTK